MSKAVNSERQPPRRTQKERRVEADARMVDAATDIIAEKGIGGLVLSDVAARAGFSGTLPLHYYKTKEALILHVAERIRADYDAILFEELRKVGGLDAIIRFIDIYFGFAQLAPSKRRAFFMITAEAAVYPALRTRIAALTREGAAGLAALIREGQRAGDIEPLVDADTFAMLILGGVRGVISLWAVDPSLDLERAKTVAIGSLLRVLRDRDAVRSVTGPLHDDG